MVLAHSACSGDTVSNNKAVYIAESDMEGKNPVK